MARERTLSEQAFEQFPQALIIVDREATVISLNSVAEHLTGWAQRDAMGRPAADILEVRTETGVNLCAPNGALRRALRLGTRINTHFAYLFRLRTSDDPVRVSYSVSPLRLKGKTPDGAVIAIHDVTRIDSGRISVDFSRVDVADVIQHVSDEVRPMLKGRTLKCRVPDNLPTIMGEARKPHQILVNLLTNAIKYSEPGTQIILS